MKPIRLSRIQTKVWKCLAPFIVLVWGRRSGKSFVSKLWLIDGALQVPGSDNWFITTTQRNARKHHFTGAGDIRRMIDPRYIKKIDQVDMVITLRNDSRILLGGRENADNMRGGGCNRMVNDEFAVQATASDKGRETWEEVLLPMLLEYDGRAILPTTPKGFNFGYDLYNQGLSPEEPDWQSFQYTTAQSGRFTHEQLEKIKHSMDPRSFRQEFEASFEALAGRVYYTFDRTAHVDSTVEDRGQELLIGQDFNVDPMSSVIAQRAGDTCEILDALEIMSSNTQEVCDEIKRRYPDRRVVFYPDPAGSARKTSAPVGQTDFTILRRAGYEVYAPSRAPAIVDRINNTNTLLRSEGGKVRVKIHPRAEKLIRGWDGLTYKEGTSLPDKGLGLDHICDAFDYLAWSAFNVLWASPSTERMRT